MVLFYLGISYHNLNGIFPKGDLKYGIYKLNESPLYQNIYEPVATVENAKRNISYINSLQIMIFTMLWVNVIDRTLFTSYGDAPSILNTKHVNSLVFFIFLLNQLAIKYTMKASKSSNLD